ncbi:DUF805 domain-containing protein [Vibrio sp. CDRSL-10 TSBA]
MSLRVMSLDSQFLQQLLFSFQGRVGRRTFWIWNLCYYLSIVVFIQLCNRLVPGLAPLLIPLLLLVLLIPDLAVTAKRWHDRNKTSWWLLLNVPLVIGRMMVPGAEDDMVATPTLLDTGATLLALLCGSWILIECGLLPAVEDHNRFGPPEQR